MRPARTVSGFDAWDAERYLVQYYSHVEADEIATLDFITRACRRITSPGRALVFGIGPTVHHLLPLAPHALELHVADYLEPNLEHVRRWLRHDLRAHDWRAFTRHVIACEGAPAASAAQISAREHLVRARVTRCLQADAGLAFPLSSARRSRYDVVLSCYCAECATSDRTVWRSYLRNILGLLAPGGLFMIAALRHCRAYRVGGHYFPCVDIDENDLASELIACGLQSDQLRLEVHPVELRERMGYGSVMMASGMRANRKSSVESSPSQFQARLPMSA